MRYAVTEVVAALIWDQDKFMICQRPPHKTRACCGSSLVAKWNKVKQRNTRSSGNVRRN